MTLIFKNIAKTLGAGFLALTLITGGIAITPQASYATTSEEKQAEADAAYAQLQEMEAQYNAAEEAYQTAYQGQLDAEAAVADAEQRIADANTRISELQTKMGTRARSMYRSGSITIIDLLFGASTFEEFINDWDFLNILNQNDADMIAETKALKAEVEEQKVVLVEQQQIATQKAQEAQEAVNQAQEVVAETQALYDSLSAEAAELLAEEQAAAEAAAAAAAQAAIEASNSGSGDSGSDDSSSSYNNSYSGVADAGSVVGRAESYVGNAEYVWGACSPGAFDCSGFVSYCLTGEYSRLGTTYTFLGWTEVSDPQPGDVCVNSGHCGIYVGGGTMIHCASPGEGVIYGPVQSGMIYVRY